MTEKRFLWMQTHIWESFVGFSALVAVIAAIAGGAFAIFEYNDRKQTARAAETLRMIEIWEERGAQEAYFALAGALETMLLELPPEERNNPANAERLRTNLPRRAIRSAPPGSYDEVVYYFTRLSLCIEASLCSAKVAATFFDDSLAGFLDWFSGEIDRRREVTPDHGSELDALSALFAEIGN